MTRQIARGHAGNAAGDGARSDGDHAPPRARGRRRTVSAASSVVTAPSMTATSNSSGIGTELGQLPVSQIDLAEHVHEVALDVRDVDLAAEAAGQADNDHAGSTALGGR